LWKGILEDTFDDFLRFVFPDIDKYVDIQQGFEFLDKELSELFPEPHKGPNTRFVDKLVKVCRRDGKKEWFLVHIEVQGDTKNKGQFPERMFQYYYRIFERYRIPLTAIAIFTAKDGDKIPDRYEYHFLGTHHIYQYNTYRITSPTEEQLQNSSNPFAIVVLAAQKALLSGKIPEKELLEQKLLIAKLLLSKKELTHQKVKSILSFLRDYIAFDDKETNCIFDKQIDEFTGKTNTMGIIEQIAEMRAQELVKERTKGLEKIVEKQIEQKIVQKIEKQLEKHFEQKNTLLVQNLLRDTDFPMQKIADLACVSLYFVKKVKSSLCYL